MATPRDKYYTKMYESLIDYNDRNDAPLSNKNIREAMHKFIAEEESDVYNITPGAHNVTVDTFSQKSDTQRENANVILTSEKLDKLLKYLTINNAVYYVS